MRTSSWLYVFVLLFSTAVLAQEPALPPPPPPPPDAVFAGGNGNRFFLHSEIGEWWKNSDTVKKLQLSDDQIGQLDRAFSNHRLKLKEYGTQMAKEDVKLQKLLDADVPNEGKINSQVDHVLTARGNLEREFTMMNLDLRKVLSLDQWHQLKEIRQQKGPGQHMFFYKEIPPGTPPPPGAIMRAPLPDQPPESSF